MTVIVEMKRSGTQFNSHVTLATLALAVTVILGLTVQPAVALSEFKPAIPDEQLADNDLPPLEGPQVGPDGGLPAPGPVIRRSDEENFPTDDSDAETTEPDSPAEIPAQTIRDLSLLPAPAARMRQLIVEAAKTGDPEQLRKLLGKGPSATRLSFGSIDTDPIEYLKSISGDGEGLEILAIILDLLDADFVRLHEGTPDDIYIWPHFVTSDLSNLTPAQEVRILRIVTAGDLNEMRSFGGYNFFRIGISPDGQWRFLLAGD